MKRALTFLVILGGGFAAGFIVGRQTGGDAVSGASSDEGKGSRLRAPVATAVTSSGKPLVVNPPNPVSTVPPSPAAGIGSDPLPGFLRKFDGDAVKLWVSGLSADQVQAELERIRAAPEGEGARRTAWYLLRRWAESDPEAAWAAAGSFPGETLPGYFLGSVAGEVAKTNLGKAMEMAMRLGVGEARNNVVNEVTDEAGKLDLAATVAFWNQHPELPGGEQGLTNIIRRIAKGDLALAASVVGQIQNPVIQKRAAVSIATQMADANPDEALRWAGQFRNPGVLSELQSHLVHQMAKDDPIGALDYAASITDLDNRRSAQMSVMSRWLSRDLQEAVRFLSQSNDSSLVEAVDHQIAFTLRSATSQEVESVMNQFPPGPIRDNLTSGVARQAMYGGDYSRSVELLNLLPDGATRDRSIRDLAHQWARTQGAAAAAWLNAQPDSTDRDIAVSGYAASLAGSAPQDAARWVASIRDPDIRIPAIQTMAVQWLQSNPAAAEQWLQSNAELSASELQQVRDAAARGYPTTFSREIKNRR